MADVRCWMHFLYDERVSVCVRVSIWDLVEVDENVYEKYLNLLLQKINKRKQNMGF